MVAPVHNLNPTILPEGSAKLRCPGNIIFFKVPRSPFIRDRDIEGGEIEEGGYE